MSDRPVPRCKNCMREHYNFVSCENAREKAEKLRAMHHMRPGSVPWGAGFNYHSKPAEMRSAPMKLGGVRLHPDWEKGN